MSTWRLVGGVAEFSTPILEGQSGEAIQAQGKALVIAVKRVELECEEIMETSIYFECFLNCRYSLTHSVAATLGLKQSLKDSVEDSGG